MVLHVRGLVTLRWLHLHELRHRARAATSNGDGHTRNARWSVLGGNLQRLGSIRSETDNVHNPSAGRADQRGAPGEERNDLGRHFARRLPTGMFGHTLRSEAG